MSANAKSAYDLIEECIARTTRALHEAHAASSEEIQKAVSVVRQLHAKGIPSDLLEQLARVLGYSEERLPLAILEFGNKICSTLHNQHASIPFASKLIAPTAFYESYPHIHELGRLLTAPIIFTEDTDAIGVASINPIAASILAGEIETAVFNRVGVRPFFTVARLDYESWVYLKRKHYDL